MNQNQSEVALRAYLQRKKKHFVKSMKQVGNRKTTFRVIASSNAASIGSTVTAKPVSGINSMLTT